MIEKSHQDMATQSQKKIKTDKSIADTRSIPYVCFGLCRSKLSA